MYIFISYQVLRTNYNKSTLVGYLRKCKASMIKQPVKTMKRHKHFEETICKLIMTSCTQKFVFIN